MKHLNLMSVLDSKKIAMNHIKKYGRFIRESLDEETQSEEEFWTDVYRKFKEVLDREDHNQNIDILSIGKEEYQPGKYGMMTKLDPKSKDSRSISCEVYTVTVYLDEQTKECITVDVVVEPSRKVWWKKDGKLMHRKIHDESKDPFSIPQKFLMGWTYYGADDDSGKAIPDINIDRETPLHHHLEDRLEETGVLDALDKAKS